MRPILTTEWRQRSMRETIRYRITGGRRARCFRCDGCGRSWVADPGPMLLDRIWLRIAREFDLLCDLCIRQRLGRVVTLGDLKAVPFNLRNWSWFPGPRL